MSEFCGRRSLRICILRFVEAFGISVSFSVKAVLQSAHV